jgi:predicted ABC-type ATPase
MPNLYIIAGPNGAGKTTYALRFLPQEMRCHEFVNADLIAAGVSPFAPAQAELEAGRIMIRRLRQLLAGRKDFAFETTLSGSGYIPLLEEARAASYRIRLDFLWLTSLDVARERIRQRVRKGGHDIPDDVQQRRFAKGIRMLIEHYRPLLDEWRIYDNTGEEPRPVVSQKDGVVIVDDHARLAAIEGASNVKIVETKPSDRVEEAVVLTPDEVDRRSMRAMRKAYADAILENLRYGLPVIQWREGRGVVAVPAELLAPLARRILETNGEPLPTAEERALLRGVP